MVHHGQYEILPHFNQHWSMMDISLELVHISIQLVRQNYTRNDIITQIIYSKEKEKINHHAIKNTRNDSNKKKVEKKSKVDNG